MRAASAIAIALALAVAAGCGKKSQDRKNDEPATGDEAVDLPRAGTQPDRKRKQYPAPPDVAGIPADAEKTAGGLAYKVLGKTGASNERPGPNDTVHVHYTAWKTTGETYFSTRDRGKPQQMQLNTVGAGWAEAMRMMTIGESRRLWLTPEQAFTPRMGPRAPRELMVYEVELTAIDRAPEVPADVAAAPADATRTPSGLAYKLLHPGTGKDRPRSFDKVEVQFTGWTPEGRMVDSTSMRKKARTGPLYKEMPGWVEGIQTMVVGERKRFWLPEKLTTGADGKSKGALVYDLQLLAISKLIPPPPVPPDVAAPPAGAERTAKGVSIRRLVAGDSGGAPAHLGDTVTLHYTGWTTDGTMFDSSVVDGPPRSFVVGRGMPGWTEALTRMSPGEKVRLWIPEALAFRGRPGPRGMVVFDMELVDVKASPKPPAAPDDVAGPPDDAQKTARGVFYKVLTPGTGDVHPRPTSTVVAHYTGWTTDGKMFDSSIPKGKPTSFTLSRVIPGWTDGIPTMVVGEKKRFWIPKELAYPDDAPGRPHGMLVFDIELVEIR